MGVCARSAPVIQGADVCVGVCVPAGCSLAWCADKLSSWLSTRPYITQRVCVTNRPPEGGHSPVPVVPRVSQGPVAGDALALSLVEGVQGVRVVAGPPAPSAQVASLIKTLQHVLPLRIRNLSIDQPVNLVVFFTSAA